MIKSWEKPSAVCVWFLVVFCFLLCAFKFTLDAQLVSRSCHHSLKTLVSLSLFFLRLFFASRPQTYIRRGTQSLTQQTRLFLIGCSLFKATSVQTYRPSQDVINRHWRHPKFANVMRRTRPLLSPPQATPTLATLTSTCTIIVSIICMYTVRV